MNFRIAVLPGDGIGPSVIHQALKVISVLEKHTAYSFDIEQALIGGIALSETGRGLPDDTISICTSSDAVLLGAVGHEFWDVEAEPPERPAASLLRLRQALDLYANVRPVAASGELLSLSFLNARALGEGVDLMIVREMSGGLFFGKPRGRRIVDGEEEAFDTMAFSRGQIERVGELAFGLAKQRRKHVTSVDQANVLESSRWWRATMSEVATEFPDILLDHVFVDNCANLLSRRPYDLDVIVVEGLLGGILSDQVASIAGSIGMLPSASIGSGRFGIFEPVHGSAPRYTGEDSVNPIAAIRSLALLMDMGLGLSEEAHLIEDSVRKVIGQGLRTYDIATEGDRTVGTEAMGDAIAVELEATLTTSRIK